MGHQVTAPVAVLRDGSGKLMYLYAGASVIDADPGDLARCISRGLIQETDDPEQATVIEPSTSDDDSGSGSGSGSDGESLERPARTASTEAWRDFRVAQGIIEADAAADLNRQQLIELADDE